MIPAPGRMIRTDISRSDKFAELTPPAAVLFALLIPHFNAHGKMQAEPYTIKGTVCPKIPYIVTSIPYDPLEIEQVKDKYHTCPTLVTELLREITQKTNVKWFRATDGLHYLHSLNYADHQKLTKKKGEDRLPSYEAQAANEPKTPPTTPTSPKQVQKKSHTSKGPVKENSLIEEEGEGGVGGEGEGNQKPIPFDDSRESVSAKNPPPADFAPGGGLGAPPSASNGENHEHEKFTPEQLEAQRILIEARRLAGIPEHGNAPTKTKSPALEIAGTPPDPDLATRVDYANPEHLAMVDVLDHAGIDTTELRTVSQLKVAFTAHRAREAQAT